MLLALTIKLLQIKLLFPVATEGFASAKPTHRNKVPAAWRQGSSIAQYLP